MNWKKFIENNYPKKEGAVSIKYPSLNSENYKEEANIQITSQDSLLNITIWCDKNFNQLFDIEIKITTDTRLVFERHFEGMEYEEENEKYLRRYIDPFLIEGWRKIDYKFLKVYKTEMLDVNGLQKVAPTHYHSLFSIIYYIISLGGLMTKKIETEYKPIINTIC